MSSTSYETLKGHPHKFKTYVFITGPEAKKSVQSSVAFTDRTNHQIASGCMPTTLSRPLSLEGLLPLPSSFKQNQSNVQSNVMTVVESKVQCENQSNGQLNAKSLVQSESKSKNRSNVQSNAMTVVESKVQYENQSNGLLNGKFELFFVK